MRYTIDWLLGQQNQQDRLKYIFFWGHQPRKDGRISESCFSQWYVSPFNVDDITYLTAEHFMMAEKAILFRDPEAFAKILDCQSPAEAKKLGRTVRNFDPTIWDNNCVDIVIQGNYHKFSQNSDLREFLVTTGDRVLVEASPVDTIWGIGLTKDDPSIEMPINWPGRNLLGFALMEVRDLLHSNSKVSPV